MVQLPRTKVGHKNAPDISPAILLWIKMDDLFRFARVDVLIQQQSHLSRITAENDKLDAAIVHHGTVGQQMIELKGRVSVNVCHVSIVIQGGRVV